MRRIRPAPTRRRHLRLVALATTAIAATLLVVPEAMLPAASAPTASATTSTTTTTTTTTTTLVVGPSATYKYSHVMVVVMENLSYASAVAEPGYQVLARRYAAATDAYGSAHPSLPNYLDLTGGSTFGITSDCTSCYVTADNLGAQLSAARISWNDYSEGAPGACYLGPYDGLYAGKHNPFRYYTDIRSSSALCHHLVPLSALYRDLHAKRQLPRFSFVTPNLCHDGHNCPPATALSWLRGFVQKVTASSSWSQSGLLVVTWDEGSDSDTSQVLPSGEVLSTGGGGHIPTLVIAPGVRHRVVAQPLAHEMLLASIEANFKLPLLRGAAAWRSHTLVLP
jgi:phosphatidylinositol-3-phosphatase